MRKVLYITVFTAWLVGYRLLDALVAPRHAWSKLGRKLNTMWRWAGGWAWHENEPWMLWTNRIGGGA